jgi:hypothetical protein
LSIANDEGNTDGSDFILGDCLEDNFRTDTGGITHSDGDPWQRTPALTKG